jgi:hypothetical protein
MTTSPSVTRAAPPLERAAASRRPRIGRAAKSGDGRRAAIKRAPVEGKSARADEIFYDLVGV